MIVLNVFYPVGTDVPVAGVKWLRREADFVVLLILMFCTARYFERKLSAIYTVALNDI
jgi:hypothetical protein